MDWFLYDRDLRHERVNVKFEQVYVNWDGIFKIENIEIRNVLDIIWLYVLNSFMTGVPII